MWCPVGRDIKLNYCYKVKKSIKLFCCLTMIHICRVIFFSKLLGSWKKLFFHLVVIIHKARVLRQFDAVFISNFYVFAITNAGLYNQFVLGKQ